MRVPRVPRRLIPAPATVVWAAAAAALVLLCALLLADLSARLQYELRGPFTADTPMYWTVGRGILNGHVPYRDLFENKPVGIFLLSAISLWVRGDFWLGSLLQTVVIGGLPVIALAVALRRSRGLARGQALAAVLLACAVSSALALYVAENSGEYQVESYGAFFVAVYAAMLAWDDRRWGAARIASAALLMGIAVSFKEPFLLTIVAVALLLTDRPRTLLRTLVIPLAVGGALTVAGLALAGYFEPYVTIHLRYMLSDHITREGGALARSVDVLRTLENVQEYSRFLAVSLCGLLAASLLGRRLSVPGAAWGLLRGGAALWLASFAVGMGSEYFNHHFVFAAPLYFAAILLFLRHVQRLAGTRWAAALTASVTALCVLGVSHLPPDREYRMKGMLQEQERAQRNAEAIDGVLSACGKKRYLFLGMHFMQPYAFTEHTPLGPTFMQWDVYAQTPQFRSQLKESAQEASLIVLEQYAGPSTEELLRPYVERHFTEEPWPCAVEAAAGSDYTLLFRQG